MKNASYTRRCQKRGEGGFSLLELIVALAVIALVLVVVIPHYRRPTETLELKVFAHRVAAQLRSARAIAITKNQDTALVFDADERWIEVVGVGERLALPVGARFALTTARQYVRGRDDARLVFFPDGSSTGGLITLGSSGQTHSIAIDWLTGAVRVEERPP